jgi:predicted RNase H-like nuclease/DNA-binding MarR family transcriptional regulator
MSDSDTILLDLFRTNQVRERLIAAAVEGTGLPPEDYPIYVLVGTEGPWTPTGLAERTRMPLSTVLFRLRRLEQRGHVERIPNPEDGRSYLVRLTPSGEELLGEARPRFRARAEAVEAALGGERVGVLRAGLDSLREAIETEIAPRPPSQVAGVDGCKGGGWIAAVLDSGRIDFQEHPDFTSVLSIDAAVIGVDIPIGLPNAEPRRADVLARKFVGPRWPSVFMTPPRPVLEATNHAEATALSVELTGKGVSRQAFELAARILEVDALARRDPRLIEVHPEVSFRALAGRPLPSKHKPEGAAIRRELLRADLTAVRRSLHKDALDAAVIAWTAERVVARAAKTLPADPEPGEPTITY